VRIGEEHALLQQPRKRRRCLLADHSGPQPVGDKQNYVVWLLGETGGYRRGSGHYRSEQKSKPSTAHHPSPIVKI
jgi:hypothetical protein